MSRKDNNNKGVKRSREKNVAIGDDRYNVEPVSPFHEVDDAEEEEEEEEEETV